MTNVNSFKDWLKGVCAANKERIDSETGILAPFDELTTEQQLFDDAAASKAKVAKARADLASDKAARAATNVRVESNLDLRPEPVPLKSVGNMVDLFNDEGAEAGHGVANSVANSISVDENAVATNRLQTTEIHRRKRRGTLGSASFPTQGGRMDPQDQFNLQAASFGGFLTTVQTAVSQRNSARSDLTLDVEAMTPAQKMKYNKLKAVGSLFAESGGVVDEEAVDAFKKKQKSFVLEWLNDDDA